ncbi:hypothetical protein IFM89_004796 [Coptis chinensis]|uniref:Fe2OG dioxygenase domain-containing protein n=1 Tax=Coptis chinensis TaxID=261450 RepID=A0A835IA52_9MAGN|nr:hypothetical protein IFM89_004796 [Coptis chinensis]
MDLKLNKNEIQCIDFTKHPQNLNQGSESWKILCTQVREASEQYGCFQVLYNKIPSHLSQHVFNQCKGLFDLPYETKLKNLNPKPYFGYLGKSDVLPFYEGFGIEDAPLVEAVQSFSHLMWPQGNPTFCETMHSISIELQELELIVIRMLCETYGVEKHYESLAESIQDLFRVMKYKVEGRVDSGIVLGAHTDKGTITILCQDEVQGLEVLSKENEWLQVAPLKGAFIVFIGETLKRMCICVSAFGHDIPSSPTLPRTPIFQKYRKNTSGVVIHIFIFGAFKSNEVHPLLDGALLNMRPDISRDGEYKEVVEEPEIGAVSASMWRRRIAPIVDFVVSLPTFGFHSSHTQLILGLLGLVLSFFGCQSMHALFGCYGRFPVKAWSNKRLHAAKHRVVLTGDRERYSYALFASPKEGVMVEVPEELVDKDHPLLYKPYNFMNFLYHFYTSDLNNENALEDYAGV